MTDRPCRFCGSTDTRRVDESYYRSDDDHGDHVIVECINCKATAPVDTWNRDPWRYPPEMPEIDDRVLLTYRPLGGEESRPITSTYYDGYEDDSHPIVRWMPIPEIPHD